MGAGAWDMISGFTYLTLRPGADPAAIHAAAAGVAEEGIVPRQRRGGEAPPLGRQDWRLVGVEDVHLSDADSPLKPGNRAGNARHVHDRRGPGAWNGLHQLHQSRDGRGKPAGP